MCNTERGHDWRRAIPVILGLLVMTGRLDPAGAARGWHRHPCRGSWLTAAEIAESRHVPPELLPLLKKERNLTPEDVCRMPDDRLARAVAKVSEPRPDNPLEWWRFRRLQLQDEWGRIPEDGLLRARAQMAKMRSVPAPQIAGINPGQWTWLGPGNVGGRIRSIVIDPADPNRIWVGSVSGGIWTTTDGGNIWSPVNDFQANLAVNTMAIHPANANVLYAGTGEGFFPGDGIRGAGIFKSTDRGSTWSQLPATATPDYWYVNRLALSPAGSTLLAATWNGIFRSTNGGTSWSRVSTPTAYDVDFNPADGMRVVAGGEGALLYSTNGGASFSSASLPTGGAGRIEVAYAPNNPSVVYAVADVNGGEVWKSTNGGQSFSLVNTGANLIGSAGWYYMALWVDPTNTNTLIVGGLDLWRSTNGGTSFSQISVWWQAPASAHADHHVLVSAPGFDGTTNRTVYFGNDGGIYRASDVYSVSGTRGWQELNNGLGITQFYGAAGVASTGNIVGGTQDNGTLLYTNAGGTEGWTSVFGGDGGFNAADPVNTNYLYGEYVVLALFRSSDGSTGNDGYIDGRAYWNGSDWKWKSPPFLITDSQNGFANFIAPFILDPNTPDRLLAGGRSLWRTDDPRTTSTLATGPTWTAIKPPNATNQNISAIAVAPGNSGIVWVGHNDGDVFKTTNGTAASPAWTQVDTGLPNRHVTRIVIDPTNADVVYVTFGGFTADNVWRTTSGGTGWADVTGSGATGLPDVPVRTLAVHPDNPAWLYAGTEVGIFTSESGGAAWSLPQDGPANVSVDELFWLDRTLVAATHGRGVYRVPTSTSSQVRVVGFTKLSTNASESAPSVNVAVRLSTSNGGVSTQAVTVNYQTVSGSATAGADFATTFGTLSFPAGTSSGSVQSVSVPLLVDTTDEDEESFGVSLSGASGASLGQTVHAVFLADDDPAPAISIGDVSVTEGNAGTTTATFTVSLSAASGRTITVTYATAAGTAGAGSDYVTTFGPLTVPAGTVGQTVAIGVNGDTTYEPNETFFVELSGASNATIADGQGLGTIANDDPIPSLAVGDVTVPRGSSGTTAAVFPVTLSSDSYQTVTVNYATADGSAVAGTDYVATSGTLSFAAGETSQSVSVTVNGLPGPEGKTFFLNLSGPANASVGDGQGQATLTSIGRDFYTVTPCRVVDTRSPTQGAPALVAGDERVFTVVGLCGIPAGASAISVNLAVTAPSAAGSLRLYPAGAAVLTTSSINYSAGQTRANNAILSLNALGELAVLCAQASGTAHLILDVNGYFESRELRSPGASRRR